MHVFRNRLLPEPLPEFIKLRRISDKSKWKIYIIPNIIRQKEIRAREENQQQGNSIIFQVLYIDQAPQRKKQLEEELDQPRKRSRGFGMGM